MPRIAGIDLPRKKPVFIALTYITGIGKSSAKKILDEAGIDYQTNSDALTSEQTNKIAKLISNEFVIEGDLRREHQMNLKRLMDLNCYRGLRHKKRLPARGQRTKTNARTRKGKKGQAVAGKKAPGKK